MYHKKRDISYINNLKQFIENKYGFNIKSVKPSERGYMAETYIINTEEGKFFVKIVSYKSHKSVYKKSFKVIDYLNKRQEIDFIIKNIKTKNNRLSCVFEGGVLGVFKHEEGEHTEDYSIKDLFEKYSLIYNLDIGNLKIKKEDFNVEILDLYKEIFLKTKKKEGAYEKIIKLLESKEGIIRLYEDKFKKIAHQCKNDLNGFYITHGDGQGNVIVYKDNITIVDWDTPLFAPIERDAWVFLRKKKILEIFNRTIKENNIEYDFKKERIGFYCLFYFFYYLVAYLEMVNNLENSTDIEKVFMELKDLFLNSNWLHKNINIVIKDF